MPRTRSILALAAIAALASFACGEGAGGDAPGPPVVESDAAPIDAGSEAAPPQATVTVRTRAPSLTASSGPLASATWAAARGDDETWRAVVPIAEGTYAIEPARDWAIAFACARADSSSVSIYERTATTTTLDVTLDAYCAPALPPPSSTIAGTLSNLPPATEWLDFAYARGARGSILPTAGGSASYEIVNVADGTWDIAFGVRDDATTPLTRVIVRRGVVIAGDGTLDVDATGAELGPSKKLDVHGIMIGDATTFTIAYAMNAAFGIDLGPQLIPDTPDVTTTYPTIPSALQMPEDRYRGHLVAESNGKTVARVVDFEIRAPLDLDVTLPGELAAPVVEKVSVAPSLRLAVSLANVPSLASSDLVAAAKPTPKSERVWRISRDAAVTAKGAAIAIPDLSSAAGWKAEWGLPSSVSITLEVGASEEAPIGDGHLRRISKKVSTLVP